MVKRNLRRRRRVRRKRTRRRTQMSSNVLSNPSSGLRNVHAVRSFNFFPPQVDKTSGAVKDTWLDKLSKYGAIAMKLFGLLLTSVNGSDLTASAVVTSSVQSMLLGAEDLLYSHPLVNLDAQQRLHVGYTVAKVKYFKVVVTMMGAIGERAGRIAGLLVPLSREQSIEFRTKKSENNTDNYPQESTSFEELTYLPGAVVAPASKGLTLKLYPSTPFSRSPIEIGSFVTNSDALGGLPIAKLIVGYQDLASNEADPSTMYSLKEAVLSVEVQACMDLSLPSVNERYIRLSPPTLMARANLQVMDGIRKKLDIPLTHFEMRDGLYQLKRDKIVEHLDLESALGCVTLK